MRHAFSFTDVSSSQLLQETQTRRVALPHAASWTELHQAPGTAAADGADDSLLLSGEQSGGPGQQPTVPSDSSDDALMAELLMPGAECSSSNATPAASPGPAAWGGWPPAPAPATATMQAAANGPATACLPEDGVHARLPVASPWTLPVVPPTPTQRQVQAEGAMDVTDGRAA